MSGKNTMTRDAMFFLPAKIIEGLLVIACTSLYAHIFTEPAVTAFNLTNTTMQLIYLVLAGWMTNAVPRYIGEEYKDDRGRDLFSTVTTIYLLLCALVAVGCVLGAVITRDPLLLCGALMFCTYTAFQILNVSLVQLGRIRASISLSLLSAALKLVVAFVLVGGKDSYPLPYPAVIAALVADGVAAIGAAVTLGLPTVARLRYFSRPLLEKFFRFGMPLVGVSISVALLNQIDKYLVVGFYGDILYAYYSQNNSIASGLFTMISIGIMRGVYPNVLRSWREGGLTATRPLLDQGVRLYLLVAVPAVAGLTAVSVPLSRFLYPEEYVAGAPVIAYTALAMLFNGLTEYANKAYELEQSTIHVLQNSAAAAVIKVISSIILLKAFGFTGGALGSIVAFGSYFVITCVRVRRRFLFRIAPACLARIVFSALLCGAAAYGCTLLPVSNLLRLALAVVAGVVVYTVCIVVSGEGREEMQMVLRKLKR